ncbi:hypothetical protein NQZ68_025059 [Dissostichus eleginoides]|nr:hypothetical protein NQZ68_025059 [Dissostichus eleginoides]
MKAEEIIETNPWMCHKTPRATEGGLSAHCNLNQRRLAPPLVHHRRHLPIDGHIALEEESIGKRREPVFDPLPQP